MHGTEIFVQLSLLIIAVTIVSTVMKRLKQPLILGYILTGLLVGVLFPLLPGQAFKVDTDSFEIFSTLGITLLLFIIGLDLKLSVFKQLGSVVFTTALAILLSLGGVGLMVLQAFGFGFTEALIAGLALFFSSTIIIVKVLSDKKEHSRLHGQIAIGVILVDDVIATLALLFVAAGNNGFNLTEIFFLGIKGVGLALLLIFLSTKVLPKTTKLFAASQELLFLFTMAWGLGIASLFSWAGFSLEVGALFAGVCLAALPYTKEMESRLSPLRDFFIVIFFITLGAGLDVSNLASGIIPALILSGAVLILKPAIVMGVMNLFGYTRRTSFKAGINLSQISEFSIILIAVSATSGLVSPELTAIMTLVALITIAGSTYLMQFDNKILARLERHFPVFRDHEEHNEKEALHHHDMILLGFRKGGNEFAKTFLKMKKKFVIVDYDPLVIDVLERRHLPHMYGDATDVQFLHEIGIRTAQMVVSTVTDFRTNLYLVRYLHRVNPSAVFICHADDHDEAAELYRLGASYVTLPHYIGSEQINHFIRKNGTTKKAFNAYKQKHLYGLGRMALKDEI
jgi:Kef-type K+ transport system membrane component KefB